MPGYTPIALRTSPSVLPANIAVQRVVEILEENYLFQYQVPRSVRRLRFDNIRNDWIPTAIEKDRTQLSEILAISPWVRIEGMIVVGSNEISAECSFMPFSQEDQRVCTRIVINSRAYDAIFNNDPLSKRLNKRAKLALVTLCTDIALAFKADAFVLSFAEEQSVVDVTSLRNAFIQSSGSILGLLNGLHRSVASDLVAERSKALYTHGEYVILDLIQPIRV